MKWVALAAAFCGLAAAQMQPTSPQVAQAELDEVRRQLAEANTSQVEALRVIEAYLAAHPATVLRPDLEHRATEAAIAIHDDDATVRWGIPTLARMPDDIRLLPEVTRALLALKTRDAVQRALTFARRSQELARQMQKDGNPGKVSPTEWRNQTDRMLNRALLDDARATGILGRPEEALATAQRAFQTYPDAAAVREIAVWDERLGKTTEAIRALADAFTIPDESASAADRAQDRAHLGELYRKAKGSEEGLGAVCLEAYDRNAALVHAREASLHRNEPNAGKTSALEFALSGLEGKSLALATLKGKVVVMDFWATWCIPCREQHPLYERVKERFHDNPSVVFLSVNADADPAPVKSFVASQKWDGPVYFEDGLARLFSLPGLPATIVLDRNGRLYTYINGFVDKELFVDALTERIRGALASPAN